MYSRAVPRAATRLTRFSQCESQLRSQSQPFAKLPSRAWRPVQQQCSRRHRSTMRETFRDQYNRSPVLFPFAIGCILLIGGWCAVYIPWYYQNVIVKPYHNFPEPVAKKLRKALFYSRGKHLDIKEANKFFRQALDTATELGMDPFSDEIMGVKYLIAKLFEDAEYYSLAVDVLEIMRADCHRWVSEFSDKHWTDGNRSRVKKNLIQINVKLGQIYDVKYVNEPDNAEKRLVEAVEDALREKQRRESEGVKSGEGDWLSNEEMGGTLEALGQHYEQNDAFYLATPLFVQALSLVPPKSCHAVVLMNNISTCLAQQTPPPASSTSAPTTPNTFPNTPAPPRAVLIDQARQWANKAIALAATIDSAERSEECDLGCVVATHNLGEFFEMDGKVAEARKKYEEAVALSKKIGFNEGQINAKAGLQRLKGLQ